jgi:hypothetical protein
VDVEKGKIDDERHENESKCSCGQVPCKVILELSSNPAGAKMGKSAPSSDLS